MSSPDLTSTLAAFMDEVWNGGNVSNLDRYLAPAYTETTLATRGMGRLSTVTSSASVWPTHGMRSLICGSTYERPSRGRAW